MSTGPTESQDAFVVRWLAVPLPPLAERTAQRAQAKYRLTRDAIRKLSGPLSRLRQRLTNRPLKPLFEQARAARKAGGVSRADALLTNLQTEVAQARAKAETLVQECGAAGRQALALLRERHASGSSTELAPSVQLLKQAADLRLQGRAEEALAVFRRILGTQRVELARSGVEPAADLGSRDWRRTYARAVRAGAIPPDAARYESVRRSLKKMESLRRRFAEALTPRRKRRSAEQLRKWQGRLEAALAEARGTPGLGTFPPVVRCLDALEAAAVERFREDKELTNVLSGAVADQTFRPGWFAWDAGVWKRIFAEAKRLGVLYRDHGFGLALRRCLKIAAREAETPAGGARTLRALEKLERAAGRLREGLANRKMLAYLDDFDRAAAVRRLGLQAGR